MANTIQNIQELKERFILVLDFDVAKHYNFGYSHPMTREKAYKIRLFAV